MSHLELSLLSGSQQPIQSEQLELKHKKMNVYSFLTWLPFPERKIFSKFPGTKIILINRTFQQLHIYSLYVFTITALRIKPFTSISVLHPAISGSSQVMAAFVTSLGYLLAPLLGYITDNYTTRYQMLSFGYILEFLGSIAICINSVLIFQLSNRHYIDGFDSPSAVLITMAILILLGYALCIIGHAAIIPNLTPYGVDQMEGASELCLSHFFLWIYVFRNIGILLMPTQYINGGVGVTHWIAIATILISNVSTCSNLIIFRLSLAFRLVERGRVYGTNIKKIFGVIFQSIRRYVKRFQEWRLLKLETGLQVNLLDCAKRSLGGSYYDEDVDDIKTFLSLIIFFILIIPYFASSNLIYSSYISQGDSLYSWQPLLIGHNCTSDSYSFWPSPLILIPINSLVVISLIVIHCYVYKFLLLFPGLKYRIAIGVIPVTLSLLMGGIVELMRLAIPHSKSCLHGYQYSVLISYLTIFVQVPQYALVAVSEVLSIVGCFEFIYAQSPFEMKGFLFGLFAFIRGFGHLLSLLIIKGLEFITCSSCSTCIIYSKRCQVASQSYPKVYIYYFTCGALSVVYTVLLLLAVYHYALRKRGATIQANIRNFIASQ